MKRLLKKFHLYFLLYKMYIPIKKMLNRKRYHLHYMNLKNDLKVAGKKKIFYIGIPIHNNLGDQAQYYCIKKYLKENYSEYSIIEIIDDILFMNFKNTLEVLKNHVNDCDIFVFQSGYRTTDVANFGGEYAHQTILKNFKNKVIVFPQTVNFSNETERKKSEQAYQANNNYIFLARDNVSYSTALEIYNKDRVLLYPDIVTSLIGNYDIKFGQKEGILLCLRNDAEKFYTDAEYDSLIHRLKSISSIIEVTDTNANCDFEFNKNKVEEEIKKKIEQFSKYKLVITDRYHGTIFSLVSNTKVIVLNSTDHKLSSGVDWFQKDYAEFVHYCNNFEDVYEMANKLYHSETKLIELAIFKTNYYDKLKDYIDEK